MAYNFLCITSSSWVLPPSISHSIHIPLLSAFTNVVVATGMMDNEAAREVRSSMKLAAWTLIVWSCCIFVTRRKLLTSSVSIYHKVCVYVGGVVSNELLPKQLPKEVLWSLFSWTNVNSIETLLCKLWINLSSLLVPPRMSLSRAHVHSGAGRWTGCHSSVARLPGHPV